jgi:nucleoside-diphosphate-sugar epimerase
VDDLVDGLVLLMETADAVTGPINIGNPAEFSIRELAEIVIDVTGSRFKIVSRLLTIRTSACLTSPLRAAADLTKSTSPILAVGRCS